MFIEGPMHRASSLEVHVFQGPMILPQGVAKDQKVVKPDDELNKVVRSRVEMFAADNAPDEQLAGLCKQNLHKCWILGGVTPQSLQIVLVGKKLCFGPFFVVLFV